MVFPHLGSENDSRLTVNSLRQNGPKLSDRLLALFVDVILISPVIQLLISQFSKKIETLSMTAPDSFEITVLILASVISTMVFLIGYQTLCWTLWGATPGKFFLKIRVVSIRGEKIVWTQAFVRSLIWVLEITLLGIPFLEVLSHYRRRPIHDRAAETTVITLKNEYDTGPHPIESNFIRQSTIAIIFLIGLWGLVGIIRAYSMAMDGTFRRDTLLDEDLLCQKVSDSAGNRVDEALALFLVGEVSDDCVEREADFQLWTSESGNRSWAFLARGLIAKDREPIAQVYFDKACEYAQKYPSSESEEACYLASQFFGKKKTDKNKAEKRAIGALSSLTAKVLELESLERQGRTGEIIVKVKEFPSSNFKEPLANYLMRANWGEHGLERSRGIFEAERLHLSTEERLVAASWMCLQEMNLNCEKALGTVACMDVFKAAPSEQIDIAWTQIKLKSCRQSSLPSLKSFGHLFAKRKDFFRLVEATAPETGWLVERRLAELGRIAKSSGGVLQSYALGEWIQLARTQGELRQVYTILEEQGNHDWKWQANVLNLFRQARNLKEFEFGFEVSQLLKPAIFQAWGLEKELVSTAFYANKRVWALHRWQEFKQAGRAPASIVDVTKDNWSEIERVFQEMKKTPHGGGQ